MESEGYIYSKSNVMNREMGPPWRWNHGVIAQEQLK